MFLYCNMILFNDDALQCNTVLLFNDDLLHCSFISYDKGP
jgi:hypothetical protein